jgi:hypothetical protein
MPIGNVIFYVFRNIIKFVLVAHNTVIKAGLPRKFYIIFVGERVIADFNPPITTDNNPCIFAIFVIFRDAVRHVFTGCSVSATSVNRILPSAACILKPLQFVTVSFPSAFKRCFNFRQ